MGRVGFEPTKAEPTDLQSVPFDRFGTDPRRTTPMPFHIPLNKFGVYFTARRVLLLAYHLSRQRRTK